MRRHQHLAQRVLLPLSNISVDLLHLGEAAGDGVLSQRVVHVLPAGTLDCLKQRVFGPLSQVGLGGKEDALDHGVQLGVLQSVGAVVEVGGVIVSQVKRQLKAKLGRRKQGRQHWLWRHLVESKFSTSRHQLFRCHQLVVDEVGDVQLRPLRVYRLHQRVQRSTVREVHLLVVVGEKTTEVLVSVFVNPGVLEPQQLRLFFVAQTPQRPSLVKGLESIVETFTLGTSKSRLSQEHKHAVGADGIGTKQFDGSVNCRSSGGSRQQLLGVNGKVVRKRGLRCLQHLHHFDTKLDQSHVQV